MPTWRPSLSSPDQHPPLLLGWPWPGPVIPTALCMPLPYPHQLRWTVGPGLQPRPVAQNRAQRAAGLGTPGLDQEHPVTSTKKRGCWAGWGAARGVWGQQPGHPYPSTFRPAQRDHNRDIPGCSHQTKHRGTKGGQRGQLQGRWAAGSKCSSPQQPVSGAWALARGARGWGHCQGKVAFAWWG